MARKLDYGWHLRVASSQPIPIADKNRNSAADPSHRNAACSQAYRTPPTRRRTRQRNRRPPLLRRAADRARNRSPVASSDPPRGTSNPDSSRDASSSLIMSRERSHFNRQAHAHPGIRSGSFG